MNRIMDATLDDKNQKYPYVIINFDWLNHDNKNQANQNAQGMAPGTKDLMTRLKQFTIELKAAGIGVSYHALGAGQTPKEIKGREKLYSRGLASAGFQRTSLPNAPQQFWR